MNSQDLIAKFKQYPIASVSLALAVLLGAVFYIRWMSYDTEIARHKKADTERAQIEESVLKNSVNLETHLESSEGLALDVTERLIRPAELAKNYQYFYRLQNVTGVRINTLQQQAAPPPAPAPAAGGARRGATAQAAQPLVSKVGYTMTFTGKYSQVLEFLHALERGEHFYQLKACSVNDAGEGLLNVSMNFDLLGVP